MDLHYYNLNDENDVQILLDSNETIDDTDETFQGILKNLKESIDFVQEDSTNENGKLKAAETYKAYVDKPCTSASISGALNKYRDFSKVDPEYMQTTLKKAKGRYQETFPIKLFKILENSDRGGYSSIISWLPHGRAFMIHDEALFKELIMGNYFHQTTYDSFKRQLYIYGFQKIRKKHIDHGSYFHELFLRNRHEFCKCILRLPKNSNNSTDSFYTPAYITIVPNFYNLPPLEELEAPSSNEMSTSIKYTSALVKNQLKNIQHTTEEQSLFKSAQCTNDFKKQKSS